MARTHYEVLGVARTASADEIRSAYRKLVLLHHPDRSKDPASKAIFLSVTESYDILSDPAERRQYDQRLRDQATKPQPGRGQSGQPQTSPRQSSSRPAPPRQTPPPKAASAPKQATSGTTSNRPPPTEPSVAEEIQRLTKLYQTGRQAEAEAKAKAILKRDARQAMPYAILGDIARGRGNVNEAAKMYAYAMQMDPRNTLYEKRYNEILSRSQIVTDKKRTRLEPEDKKILVPMAGGGVVIVAAIGLGLNQGEPLLGWLGPVSTWTFGSIICMFLSGVTVGASLSIGNLVDRYGETNVSSTGRFSPMVALGCISVVQFWFAAALYGAIGIAQRGWNQSTTRLVIGVGAATLALSLAACLNVSVNPLQVFTWGGNMVYMGALCGWIVADAFR